MLGWCAWMKLTWSNHTPSKTRTNAVSRGTPREEAMLPTARRSSPASGRQWSVSRRWERARNKTRPLPEWLLAGFNLQSQSSEQNKKLPFCLLVVSIAHRISHETNVVVVNNQSANNKFFLLLFDWMLTTTTFVTWDILWAMNITVSSTHIQISESQRRRGPTSR